MASLPLMCLCGFAMVLIAAPAFAGTPAVVTTRAQTIKCYGCFGTSDNDFLGCPDEISPTTNVSQVDCDGFCVKVKSGGVIIRTCSSIGKFDFCKENGDDVACVCDTDLCNGNYPVADSLRTCAPYRAPSAQTIKCYNCGPNEESPCPEEFSPITIPQKDCNGSCVKVKSGDEVLRGCSSIGKFDFCKENGDDATCLCDTDRCNGDDSVADSQRTCGPEESAKTIKCYVCGSDSEPCPKRFSPTANVRQVDCGGSCLKIESEDGVVYGCNPYGKFDFCKENDDEETVCMCDTNLCNGNDPISSSTCSGNSLVAFSIAAISSLAIVAALITRM